MIGLTGALRRVVATFFCLLTVGAAGVTDAAAGESAPLIFTLLAGRSEAVTVTEIDLEQRRAKVQRRDGKVIEMFLSPVIRHVAEVRPGRTVTAYYDEILVVQHLPAGRGREGAYSAPDFVRFTVSSIDYPRRRASIVEEGGGEVRSVTFAFFTWDEEIERIRTGDMMEGIIIRSLFDVGPPIGMVSAEGFRAAGSLFQSSLRADRLR